jgi:hypothetical protein
MAKARGGKNAVIEFERDDPLILKALRSAKRYQKVGQVRARKVKRRTPVETVLADGTKETSNIAGPGDYIVTGPRGERYVLQPETFEARYVLKPGAKYIFLARGETAAIQNPFGRPISIVASWGERQFGAADCMIADRIDPTTNRRAGKPYIIGLAEFAQTYERSALRKKR